VFAGRADWASSPAVPINRDESGKLVTSDFCVWTHSAIGGRVHPNTQASCMNWISNDFALDAAGIGRCDMAAPTACAGGSCSWLDAPGSCVTSCGVRHRLYCFEY
jgi:hypothetical protein